MGNHCLRTLNGSVLTTWHEPWIVVPVRPVARRQAFPGRPAPSRRARLSPHYGGSFAREGGAGGASSLARFGITTSPLSVTKKRRRSASRS